MFVNRWKSNVIFNNLHPLIHLYNEYTFGILEPQLDLQGGRELKNFNFEIVSHCPHIQTKTTLELSHCKLN